MRDVLLMLNGGEMFNGKIVALSFLTFGQSGGIIKSGKWQL